MSTKTKTLSTWLDLLAIDPTLRDIDRQIDFYRGKINDRNQWTIYERMKSQIWRRVGWFADHAPDELRTCEAYEIALHHFCDELGI
jgi:hypothetical protein